MSNELAVLLQQNPALLQTGLDADTIVFWSPVMGVETYLQCITRLDRDWETKLLIRYS